MIISSLILFCLFFAFIGYNQRQSIAAEKQKVHEQGQVVSASLWSFEKQTPKNYLSLALKTNNYRAITVIDEMGQTFIHLNGAPLTGLDAFLSRLGFMVNKDIASPIIFEKKTIGEIQVIWTNNEIYRYLYILFCILLLLLGLDLYLKLLDANRNLEQGVKNRTQALEQEIEEHTKTSAELAIQAQRLSMHVRNTPLGVVEWSLQFTVQSWNMAAETIFGFKAEDVIGRHAFDFLIPDDEKEKALQHMEMLMHGKPAGRSISMNVTQEGKIKTCCWYNTALKDSNDTVIGIASLVLDITEQVEAERKNKDLQNQLIQAQKMEAIGNLAGGIAHDFNNLLQSIIGYTQLLLLTCPANDNACKKLHGIEETAKRAAVLVKKLLTFSRKVESHLAPLDLNTELTHIIIVLQHTLPRMVQIKTFLAPALAMIEADALQIEQILLNLAINASHAMPHGGTLTITTENTLLDKAFCTAHMGAKEGLNVVLRITDTGTGMTEQTLEKIFEPFFTTKEPGKGTGLGLSTVYGIVSAHHGSIHCTSTIGEGTTFTLYFPAIDELVMDHPPCKEEKNILRHGKETILLVDDEAPLREIGKQILQTLGYEVLLAQNGEEALSLYDAQKRDIHLLAIDLNMPGMGGSKCIERLREQDKQIPILVISGFLSSSEAKHLAQLAITGSISKPYTIDSLSKGVRRALDRHKGKRSKKTAQSEIHSPMIENFM